MDRRSILTDNYATISTKHPEFTSCGFDVAILKAYNVIFENERVTNWMTINLTPHQKRRIEDLMHTVFGLITKSDIIPNAKPEIMVEMPHAADTSLSSDNYTEQSAEDKNCITAPTKKDIEDFIAIYGEPKPYDPLLKIAPSELSHILQLAISAQMSERDEQTRGKYKRRVPGQPTKRKNTLTEKLRKKQKKILLKMNVIYPAPPQRILTQRRRWFNNAFDAMPEQLYAASVFYLVDEIILHPEMERTQYIMISDVIKELVKLATQNAQKKKSALISVIGKK